MALPTAQYAAQTAALIVAHNAGSVSDAAFEAQFAALLGQWGVSNPTLAAAIAAQTSAFNAIPAQLSTWLAGPVDGGYHADGTPSTGAGDPLAGNYPVTNVGGAVSFIPSPAKQAATTAKGDKGDKGDPGAPGPPGPPGVLTAYAGTRFTPPAGTVITLPKAIPAGAIIDVDVGGQRQWEGLDFTVATSAGVSTLTLNGSGVDGQTAITYRTLTVQASS